MTKAFNINNLNSEFLTPSLANTAGRQGLWYQNGVNVKENNLRPPKDRSRENLLWTMLFFLILSILR
jgi:hypothetical protein